MIGWVHPICLIANQTKGQVVCGPGREDAGGSRDSLWALPMVAKVLVYPH